MILRPRGSTFGVGFRRARSMRLCATCFYAGVNRVSRCRAALLCSHSISGVGLRHARSMRLCATCFYAGVNSVSRCRAVLLCSHWLSSASAFAVPARCDCVPHASMLASTASRVAGLHFCAVTGYLRRRLSPRTLDAAFRHASMLACQPRLALQGCTSVQSLAIFGVGFSPRTLDAAFRHASMLASTAPRVALLHFIVTEVSGFGCAPSPTRLMWR